MKKIIITSLLLMMMCCKEEKKETIVSAIDIPKEKVVSEGKSNESEDAKKWLVESIEKFFKTDLSTMDKAMEEITTKDYYEYKTDATNVDMDVDGSLTLKEFQNKWKSKFDTEKAGTGVGFLISGQDWNEIKVTKCLLLSQHENTYVFDVLLTDKQYKEEYPVQVKVIQEKDGFRIADVLQ